MKSILTKNQKKSFSKAGVIVDGQKVDITATVRYDDECGNGHNSFSITGNMWEANKPHTDRYNLGGGCIHESIEQAFPELKPFIKWHLTSSDGPIHYIANTMYHARNRTHDDVEIGEPVAFTTKLKFKNSPFTFKEQEKGFWDYLNNIGDFNNVEVEPVSYDGLDSYAYSDNYSFIGFIKENQDKKWYKTPFNDLTKANEFLEALQTDSYEYIKTPTKWCEPVEPNLEYARSSAVWPNATLEQLQDEQVLTDRLPALMAEFKADVETLGFTY